MKKRIKLVTTLVGLLMLSAALIFVGCELNGSDSGAVELSITDAPVNDTDIDGVYITIDEVQYNNGGWVAMEGFDGPQTYNLLELTNGESALLGTLSLPAGQYEQIRFMLSSTEEPTQGNPFSGNSGCWVSYDENDTYDEGADAPLFIPSGEQTGYKATADTPFLVPENGTIALTADFVLSEALVERPQKEAFILKPVLRLIVENEAGSISGTVNYTGQDTAPASMVVYAYGDGSFDSSTETSSTVDETTEEITNEFSGAVTSSIVSAGDAEDGGYTLAFLAAGTYDLVVAQYDAEGNYIEGSGAEVDKADVTVSAGEKTTGIQIDEDD